MYGRNVIARRALINNSAVLKTQRIFDATTDSCSSYANVKRFRDEHGYSLHEHHEICKNIVKLNGNCSRMPPTATDFKSNDRFAQMIRSRTMRIQIRSVTARKSMSHFIGKNLERINQELLSVCSAHREHYD